MNKVESRRVFWEVTFSTVATEDRVVRTLSKESGDAVRELALASIHTDGHQTQTQFFFSDLFFLDMFLCCREYELESEKSAELLLRAKLCRFN